MGISAFVRSPRRASLGAGLLLAGLLGPGAAVPAHAGGTAGVEVETLVKSAASWNGRTLPGYPAGAPEITILRIRIPPGARLPMHEHPVINAGVLLAGTLKVVARSGETLRLNAGDALVELVNTWHHGGNDGDVPAEIVVFYAGVKNAPITVPHPAD